MNKVGIDITNIYDGKGNQWWGIEKTTITMTIKQIKKLAADTLTRQIETNSNTQYLKDKKLTEQIFLISNKMFRLHLLCCVCKTDFSKSRKNVKHFLLLKM